MKKMKRILATILMLGTVFSMSGCKYDLPENAQRWHYGYDDAVKYAKSIDPDATVAQHNNRDIKEYGYEYREWNAVIYGVECHVTSVEKLAYNTGLGLYFWHKSYYVFDTDYDYFVLKNILREKQPTWEVVEGDYWGFYQADCLAVEVDVQEDSELSDEELMKLWDDVVEINDEYNSYNVRDEIRVRVPAPQETIGGVTMSFMVFYGFTEGDRDRLFGYYHEYWQKYGDQLTQ